MMLIEALAAGLVGVVVLWLVIQPLVMPKPAAAAPIEFIDPEETVSGQALLALKEIEFDRATGKLSDEDYTNLHERYSRTAIAALAPIDNCDACGLTLPAEMRFCPNCGAARAVIPTS
jgi:hypothetical protein